MHQDYELSPPERRVVAGVAEGKTNKQIALEAFTFLCESSYDCAGY